MDEIVSSPPSPGTRKRPAPEEDSPEKKPLNLKGNQFIMPTPPDTDQSSNASPHTASREDRAASPAGSSSALSSIESASQLGESSKSTTNPGRDGQNAPQRTAFSGEPPKKRRKLTPAEKQEQQRVKDIKDREKAEQKTRRDEEKRVKDEEKRRKAEERDAKRREKEVEEERKQQEKLKKERSQMRLAAFFQKPATPVKPPSNGEDADLEATRTARRRSLSLETFDSVADQIRQSASPCKTAPKAAVPAPEPVLAAGPSRPATSDYKRYFLPFVLPSHASLAERPLANRSEEDRDLAQSTFDSQLNDPSLREKYDLGIVESYASLRQHFAHERAGIRGLQMPTMRSLVEQIQGSSQQPIDLTEDERPHQPMEILRKIPLRHLHFREDVRPAYFGTYTKTFSPLRATRMGRDPFSRVRDDTDYDYDSEAEWEEPEEGEDILNEEDDEAESLGDVDEMDGFLDDEDDQLKTRRKMITGDLEPVSTGVCWENGRRLLCTTSEARDVTKGMKGMRMEVLLPKMQTQTIDPFSTTYWQSDPVPAPVQLGPMNDPSHLAVPATMPPPSRTPLQQLPSGNRTATQMLLVGAAEGEKGPITSIAAGQNKKPGRKPSPKTISEEDFAEFKDAVVGSQLGKADLCKGLKLRFKKMTNDVIKDTLSTHFAQVGGSKADKKWVFVGVT